MAKVTDAVGHPFSGLVPWAVVGIVDNNVDPRGFGRIRVKFPTLHEEPLSFWIRVAMPMAGLKRGFYALPEEGDEVLVLFVQGSQDVGVVIGQLWNGVDLPPTEAAAGMPGADATKTGAKWSTDTFENGSTTIDDNDRRFWRSRSGHLFVFDDTKKAETIQIWDHTHKLSLVFDSKNERILLSNTAGDIHVRSGRDLYLEADRDIKWRAGKNIEGESVGKTSHKVGKTYDLDVDGKATLKSGGKFTAQSTGAGLTCKSAGKTSCEGRMFEATGSSGAKLKSTSMCEISSGIVKIN